jgi:TPR repeat protein
LFEQKYDSAYKYLRRGAEAGHAECQFLYGTGLLKGVGIRRDTRAGLAWLEKAATAGHVLALRYLALEYFRETEAFETDHVRKPRRAFECALRAARADDEIGIFLLARAYREGRAYNGDRAFGSDSLAVFWMTRAAQHHRYPPAQLALGDWFYRGETQYGGDPDRAAHFYQAAAKNPRSDPDQQAEAEIGAHYAIQLKRLVVNIHHYLPFLDPRPVPFLRLTP